MIDNIRNILQETSLFLRKGSRFWITKIYSNKTMGNLVKTKGIKDRFYYIDEWDGNLITKAWALNDG